MPLSSPKKLTAGYQPINGYTLEEMIGRGGFGEVWRADAPGGIKKAVKFVFGDPHDHRAERELKSLERIKGVQHPFLLALERFEIVDGQLVIVTELADGSLEDVFNQHRERGSCGIPRNALLTYMNDAADALDYLHEMYQLQHLDIKPANLLMVGGHVKVADFGLLKDLRDADCSIIGGLTPIYAPPEIFDGKPSMNSDQYSLGVMYQEMLTGVRPFSGRTIAQLATQHVHNAPNLESLPSSDQPIIARALEKNPDRRYPSCRDFVAELRVPHRRPSSGDFTKTTIGFTNVPISIEPKEVTDLPEIGGVASNATKTPVEPCTGRPVLVVALGGSGARCVSRLRRQLSASADKPIALHAITIDTDIQSSREVGNAEPTESVLWCKSLHTPLRTAQEYRKHGADHLRTVSRRWLYNLPRSGQTEGMRPLGRLALVDHGKEVTKAIQEAVQATLRSSENSKPLVYVVGSTSGGTSSGMYMDVVNVLRHCLDEAGLQGTRVISLLLAPAMRCDPRRPLILHDTKAMLSEIAHLMKPGNGYPGDMGAEWPSIPAARTPLRDTYVITASTEPGMPSPIQSACDYIHLAGSGAADILASARRGKSDLDSTSIESSSVRSLGIIQLSGARTRDHRVLASKAARQLMLQWLGKPSEARETAPLVAERLKRRARLGIMEFAEPIIKSFAEDRNARRAKLMIYLRSLPVEQLRDIAGCREDLVRFIVRNTECRESNAILTEAADTLQRELAARLHDRECDLSTAVQAVRVLTDHLRGELAALQSQLSQPSQTPSQLVPPDDNSHLIPLSDTQERDGEQSEMVGSSLIGELRSATGMGEQLLNEFAYQQSFSQVTELCDMLGRLEERLSDGAAKVALCIRSADEAGAKRASVHSSETAGSQKRIMIEAHGRLAARWLIGLLADTAAAIDPIEMCSKTIAEIESIMSEEEVSRVSTRDTRDGHVRSSTMIAGHSTLAHDPTNTEMLDTASMIGDSIAVTCQLGGQGEDERQPMVIRPPTVEDAIRAVRPPLLDCGGSQRLILFVATEEDQSQYEASVREAHKGELTVAVIPHCIPTLVHEAQQIQIDEILKRLSSLTVGQDEISRRLQSRCDVDW